MKAALTVTLAMLLAIAVSSCASPSAKKRFLAASIVADGASTYYALEHRGCKEKNPLYGNMNGAGILAINVAIAALIEYIGDDLPGWFAYGLGTLRFGIAANNLRC